MPDILEPRFGPYTDTQPSGQGTDGGRQRLPYMIGDVELGQIVQPGQPFPVYGIQPLNATSIVYEASRIVSTRPSVLFGLSGYSSRTTSQFILLLDMLPTANNTLPADGAVPVIIIAVGGSSNFAIDFSSAPRLFNNGIIICNSSTGPTKTIGSADCWFDVQYL